MKKKEILFLFVVTLVFQLFIFSLHGDEIWNYGFAYNIANGLVPYRDFNLIVTPLYPAICGIFLLLFGKSFLLFHMINSILVVLICLVVKKKYPKGIWCFFLFFLLCSFPTYNLLSYFFFFVLLLLEEKNASSLWIGFVLGLCFLTKQSVGIVLVLPSFFFCCKKEVFQRMIGWSIPNVLFLLFLILTSSLIPFLDYTIFGLGEFQKLNFMVSPILFLEFVILLYLVYQMKRQREKRRELLYILVFQIIVYPLFDGYHFLLAFLPVFSYFMQTIPWRKAVDFYCSISITALVFFHFILTIGIEIPNQTKMFRYRNMTQETEQTILEMSRLVQKLAKEGQVFLFHDFSYVIKLEIGLPITKYDLINAGNMGKNGTERYQKEIEEICNKMRCFFLLSQHESTKTSQMDQKLQQFVRDHYRKGAEYGDFELYEGEANSNF